MYEHLKALRESLGMTQAEFGRSVGIAKSTYNNYETGIRDPKSDFWIAVAQKYGVTIDYLMGFSNDPKKTSIYQKASSDISEEARKIARSYDRISELGKGAVRAILEYEEKSAAIKAVKGKNVAAQAEAARMVEMIVYRNPASAGVPLYAEDDYDRIEFRENEVEPGADFGIRISGDSMEPTIPDGSIVWVRKTPEIDNGQIGVFMINDSAVCKRFHKDETAMLLESDNKKYPPIPIKEFDRLGLVGRVLGFK